MMLKNAAHIHEAQKGSQNCEICLKYAVRTYDVHSKLHK